MRPLLPTLAFLLLAPLPALADGSAAEAAARPQAAPVRVALASVTERARTPLPLPVTRSERSLPRACGDMRCPTFIVLGTAY